jgi:hypothetical protein
MDDKLDRKRSYGTVYGDPNVGFIQDGKSYRPDGSLYSPPAPPTKVEPVQEERRPTQSETMKKIWAERREAQQRAIETESASP